MHTALAAETPDAYRNLPLTADPELPVLNSALYLPDYQLPH